MRSLLTLTGIGVTVYAVTAWDPHIPLDQALEGLMYWHLIARKYPNITIVTKAEDIQSAKQNNKAGLCWHPSAEILLATNCIVSRHSTASGCAC